MDRADWLRIGASLGVALLSSDSAVEDMRAMMFSARDAFAFVTETDRTGVNLDPMNVETMLRLPYVDGTRPDRPSSHRMTSHANRVAPRSPTPMRITLGNMRPIVPDAPTYTRAFRSAKKLTG